MISMPAIEPATSIIASHGLDPTTDNINFISFLISSGNARAGQPVAPIAPAASEQASNPGSYLIYLNQYKTYLLQVSQFWSQNLGAVPTVDALVPPTVQPVAVIGTSTITIPGVTDNTPSPQAGAGNPVPLLSASLTGGASSSFCPYRPVLPGFGSSILHRPI